ncbi:MAG: hypothetical protein WAU70_13770 [Flavobacteriales bacterium]
MLLFSEEADEPMTMNVRPQGPNAGDQLRPVDPVVEKHRGQRALATTIGKAVAQVFCAVIAPAGVRSIEKMRRRSKAFERSGLFVGSLGFSCKVGSSP